MMFFKEYIDKYDENQNILNFVELWKYNYEYRASQKTDSPLEEYVNIKLIYQELQRRLDKLNFNIIWPNL